MKLKSKKSALLLSFTSLLLCFAMLVGSTFAWFTDTATTGVNKIQAGNLDVELLMYKEVNGQSNYVNISKEPAPIFGSETSTVAQNNNLDTLWEPGKTQVASGDQERGQSGSEVSGGAECGQSCRRQRPV